MSEFANMAQRVDKSVAIKTMLATRQEIAARRREAPNGLAAHPVFEAVEAVEARVATWAAAFPGRWKRFEEDPAGTLEELRWTDPELHASLMHVGTRVAEVMKLPRVRR